MNMRKLSPHLNRRRNDFSASPDTACKASFTNKNASSVAMCLRDDQFLRPSKGGLPCLRFSSLEYGSGAFWLHSILIKANASSQLLGGMLTWLCCCDDWV
jgi:hypothetical protein